MVTAAYSSGRPALGVGAGNVQCIIDEGYDYKVAVPKIITGRSYDYGIICSGEQSIICHKKDYDAVLKECEANNCYVVRDDKERDALRAAIFDDKGKPISNSVGQSAETIAEMAGFSVPKGTRAIVVQPCLLYTSQRAAEGTNRGSAAIHNIKTVSYTHLDVYKRQGLRPS